MTWPPRRRGRIDFSTAAKLPVATGSSGSTPDRQANLGLSVETFGICLGAAKLSVRDAREE